VNGEASNSLAPQTWKRKPRKIQTHAHPLNSCTHTRTLSPYCNPANCIINTSCAIDYWSEQSLNQHLPPPTCDLHSEQMHRQMHPKCPFIGYHLNPRQWDTLAVCIGGQKEKIISFLHLSATDWTWLVISGGRGATCYGFVARREIHPRDCYQFFP